MALGAAGDDGLAERVGAATARELSALGVNVNYAPVCDVANNPANPALGIRSFGDDPPAVGRLAAATVRGLQSEGVAATAKHFPGAGDTTGDPHHVLPVVPRTPSELAERELVPFEAAFRAGARMVMTGHFALPGAADDLPTSLSPEILRGIAREQLHFDGVTVSDALDMHALAQGAGQIVDAIAACGQARMSCSARPTKPTCNASNKAWPRLSVESWSIPPTMPPPTRACTSSAAGWVGSRNRP
jgi:beta-N-acetylhexosaminidase